MGPELNVVIGRLFDFLIQLSKEAFKRDDDGYVEVLEGLLSAHFSILAELIDQIVLNKPLCAVDGELLLRVCITFLSDVQL